MHREGHIGAALLAYAPVGGLALALGAREVSALGLVAAAGFAMAPDWDQQLPVVTHRGITHTVWFVLAGAVVLGVAGVGLAGVVGGVVGVVVGVTTLGSHLLADMLTPMGVRPFEPLNDRHYTLDVVKAANPVANYVLLVVGVGAVVVAYALATGALG